ncbi:MAG: inorganic phosphate transporter [Rikenellaceae bacterium]|nr:inorganic phosphate transporter [Rikenellaceae bacterium]
MSLLYTFILVVLAILAILGIVVGVSNDAVNFLNSAIGSKVASFRKILIVASIGILVGVITSSGMMEVARSGVFHPEMFTFHEIMFLFLGMMLGNVILLDVFNSLGLPTSTTVSMVFGLLGSAMALAIFKINESDTLTMANMGQFINSGKALAIVSGILLSVVIAFIVGGIYMYLSRALFSFRYQKLFGKIGWLWCGVSLAGILYFALFKGLKSSGLIPVEVIDWVNSNVGLALLIMWGVSSVVLLLLQLCKVDILKVTILAGTFSLALAFAGNDLVNFIGAPYAAFDAYGIAKNAGGATDITMEGLKTPVAANFLIMLGAGLVMILTLFLSKKTKKVIQTEQSLAGQDENTTGNFDSNFISRAIVRGAVNINNFYERVIPRRMQIAIEKRFIPLPVEERGGLVYDRIRATVNLTCASLLIAVGTTLKLPLSTTYVVFMVSMASSLADRAWGRESAVYRVTGVMTVITGWFITALAGFAISMAVTMLLAWGGWIAAVALSLLGIYLVVKGNFFNKEDKKDDKADSKKNIDITDKSHNANEALIGYIENVCVDMESVTRIYGRTIVAVFKENRKVLRDMVKESNELFFSAREQKYALLGMMKKLEQQDIITAPFYVQVVDYMSETTKALIHITRPAFDHIDNNHTGFTKEQIVDLKQVNDSVEEIFSSINSMLRNRDFSDMSVILEKRDRLFDMIDDIMKSQLRRMRVEHMSTSASILFFNILNETKTMVLQSRNIMKSLEHFVED